MTHELPQVERAIYITNLEKLRFFKDNQCHRIYWGVEFCQNLIPPLGDTEIILKFADKNKLGFSLVTPFVTERGLKKLHGMFAWLKKQKIKNIEVIVNDWGVLNVLNTEFKGIFALALGRLLVRQQRNPAMKKVLEKQPVFAIKCKDGTIRIIVHRPPGAKYREGMQSSYINTSFMRDFLSQVGIKRVELNNLIQGVDLSGIKLKKSLYTPYINISTTRFCPMETKHQKIYRINVCKRECQKYYDVLRIPAVPGIIYKRGNTTFYENALNPARLNEYDVDRIVFQPELPF